MKKIIFLLIIFLFSCIGNMERVQWQKAREAESSGLPRRIRIFESGQLVYDLSGRCNLELADTNGFITITTVNDNVFLDNKIRCSEHTLIIIEEHENPGSILEKGS